MHRALLLAPGGMDNDRAPNPHRRSQPSETNAPPQVNSTRKSSNLNGWRLQRVTLQVTDGMGAKQPGVTVDAAWTHQPARGNPQLFSRRVVRATSGRGAKGGGEITLSGPRSVAYGDQVVLTVLFARNTKNSACDFSRATSDVATAFSCGSQGCK